MNHFRPVAHIDTFDMVGTLRERMGLFSRITLRQEYDGSAHKDTRTIYLRGPEPRKTPLAEAWFQDVEHVNYAPLKEWPEAIQTLNAIFDAKFRIPFGGSEVPPTPYSYAGALAKAMIVELAPGGVVQWHKDEGAYADKHHRFHLPLVTNPYCIMASGDEALRLPVGQLTWFDNHVMHSAVNFGTTPRYHLIVDYRIAA